MSVSCVASQINVVLGLHNLRFDPVFPDLLEAFCHHYTEHSTGMEDLHPLNVQMHSHLFHAIEVIIFFAPKANGGEICLMI